ncbi:hypothetical protein GOBAR_AA23240 [Gossypium barbadense]|uniref:Uncharacterized protein n=1 Tax=Gossypium barbadense TaxID=3634 RepID=A0A2P5X278_GOSBA|nr:hypothetical protein GOBAR_AA23240 [Gossypium barbadense]
MVGGWGDSWWKRWQAGGTWLASSRDGRLAFITNFRELQSIPQAKSRGNLPVDFLQDAILELMKKRVLVE